MIALFIFLLFAGIYLSGIACAFAMGAADRTSAQNTIDVYSDSSDLIQDFADQRISEAKKEYAAGCRQQVRAPLWPVDGARWLKSQILTAFVYQEGK